VRRQNGGLHRALFLVLGAWGGIAATLLAVLIDCPPRVRGVLLNPLILRVFFRVLTIFTSQIIF